MFMYLIYFGITGWVVLTTWPGVRVTEQRRERQLVAVLMTVLPIALAAVLTYGLMQDNSWAAGLFGLFFGGLLLLGVGLAFRAKLPGRSSISWRLLGWAAASSVLLIPSTLAVLSFIPALLAFLVPGPEGWLSGQEDAVGEQGKG